MDFAVPYEGVIEPRTFHVKSGEDRLHPSVDDCGVDQPPLEGVPLYTYKSSLADFSIWSIVGTSHIVVSTGHHKLKDTCRARVPFTG